MPGRDHRRDGYAKRDARTVGIRDSAGAGEIDLGSVGIQFGASGPDVTVSGGFSLDLGSAGIRFGVDSLTFTVTGAPPSVDLGSAGIKFGCSPVTLTGSGNKQGGLIPAMHGCGL